MKRLKRLGKLFQSESDATIAVPKLDPKLEKTLKENHLDDYVSNFASMKCLFDDLPNLSSKELKALIPDKIPRGRLEKFIKANFVSNTSSNGWEIDSSSVVYRKDSKVINTGSYGKIKVASFKVGIAEIPIAVKEIVIDNVTTNKDSVIHEVMCMSKLKNRHVLKCFGCWFSEDEKTANICLEYCGKGDLYNYMKKNPELDPLKKMEFLHQIALGMAYIHKEGMIHRDMKPQNILVSDDESTLKICDFGTSKTVEKVHGTLCGTPAYLSPEQFDGRNTKNPKLIDIFAFGVIAWEIWTGKIPYEKLQKKYRNNTFKFLMAIHGTEGTEIQRPDVGIKELKDCPEDLVDLMQGCWESDIDDRPPSFDFIVEELQFYIAEYKRKAKAKNEDQGDFGGDSDSDF